MQEKKFIFNLTKPQQSWLEEKKQKEFVPKAVILRRLINQEIKRDKRRQKEE
jgi:hypothetical protein